MAIGSLKMSLPGSSSAELRRLHNISQSIENMDAILEKCSLMNTVDQKLEKLKIEPLNLNEFLKEIIQQQPENNRFKLIKFDDLVIQSDRNLLKIAVNNILENALKYSVSESVILVELLTVQADSKAPKVEIVVTNKINELWAPDPSLLFSRFYRHPLALKTTGSGLGLYLVDEICRLLGGAVRYTRTLDSVKFHIEVSA
jgi:signal transduction histidine kinase